MADSKISRQFAMFGNAQNFKYQGGMNFPDHSIDNGSKDGIFG
jgi:hypothetical protein